MTPEQWLRPCVLISKQKAETVGGEGEPGRHGLLELQSSPSVTPPPTRPGLPVLPKRKSLWGTFSFKPPHVTWVLGAELVQSSGGSASAPHLLLFSHGHLHRVLVRSVVSASALPQHLLCTHL